MRGRGWRTTLNPPGVSGYKVSAAGEFPPQRGQESRPRPETLASPSSLEVFYISTVDLGTPCSLF
ncbi:hypothetical protein C0Q70_03951 [Pomacea canaliculata]|uniref:Uncharacterized protein n=1 Tax=Pomacea canaliculata TaxID=400727 RepID=A0A2T7PU70_POMCA|nr:hypothetical protein C0Q70_03951 [Pomacea canaliculata]